MNSLLAPEFVFSARRFALAIDTHNDIHSFEHDENNPAQTGTPGANSIVARPGAEDTFAENSKNLTTMKEMIKWQ